MKLTIAVDIVLQSAIEKLEQARQSNDSHARDDERILNAAVEKVKNLLYTLEN